VSNDNDERTDVLLRKRAGRADLDWFDTFMDRDGGEAPAKDDRLP